MSKPEGVPVRITEDGMVVSCEKSITGNGRAFTLPELAARDEAVRREALEEAGKGLQTELSSGKVLNPMSDADFAHNEATDRAIRLVRRYQVGEGLFQIRALAGKETK